ncbi:MAG TPA: DNA gyrase inhibitor YacG [Stellaceae bacterium]|nr:DNA gyrase inhibitor YacG [Stellaceae bacterium]
MPPDSSDPKPPSARPCPLCGKPAHPRHRPFCSRRCAEIDLGRWLKGTYRIPDEEPTDEGEEEMRNRD